MVQKREKLEGYKTEKWIYSNEKISLQGVQWGIYIVNPNNTNISNNLPQVVYNNSPSWDDNSVKTKENTMKEKCEKYNGWKWYEGSLTTIGRS